MNERCTILQQDESCWHELHNPLSPTFFLNFAHENSPIYWYQIQIRAMLVKFEKMSWFVDICQCYLFFSQWIALLCPLGNSRQCSVHCTINPESVNCTMTFKVTCFVCNFNFSLTSFTARYIDTLSVTFHFIMPWIKSYFDFNVMRNYHTRYLYWIDN